MGKRIALCLDGTWNEEGRSDGDVEVATNVLKLYRGLDGDAGQPARYFPGVDTRPFEKVAGGAFGWGLFEQIKDAYRALLALYAPGDAIHLFGFSRGAYAARSLAGMIQRCGVLRDDTRQRALTLDPDLGALLATTLDSHVPPDATDTVFALYKLAYDPANHAAVARFKHDNCHAADIRFLGVWDTVGALGVPDKLVPPARGGTEGRLRRAWFGFPDTRLGPGIRAACHALAIDERREPFLPTLWTDAPGAPARINAPDGAVRQVWFAGAHANVGGGYAESGLSDITLGWMTRHAGAQGVTFAPGFAAGLRPDATALRRDSLGEFLLPRASHAHKALALGVLVERFGTAVEDIARSQLEVARPIARGAVIHASVDARLAAQAVAEPEGRAPYAPPPTLRLDAAARRVDRARYAIAE